MTKTISLSDEAYEMLSRAKRPGESFSDTTMRLARRAAQERLFDPDFGVEMSDEEVEAEIRAIYEARDQEMEPRARFPEDEPGGEGSG